ncbi:MAG: hypothetical protein KDJ52_29135 [Anaerolineae bacterium]|nr:hypothetical protein [Anaerolineae bacterium]
MLTWERRPAEVANLFNPAFCSILLRGAVNTYQKEQDAGMPYVLSFLILPLVLHKTTRDALPNTIRTRMHVWLQNKPETQIGFVNRIKQLTPITKEAIIFGMQSDLFTFDEKGNLVLVSRRFKSPPWTDDSEPTFCYRKSQFLGRWLAQVGDTATILTMWGIRP